MAWYPRAKKMELQPESDAQAAIRPTQFIIHSVVAPWDEKRIYEYWRDSTSLESHFGLDYDGSMGQYIGTETRADANAGANRRADGTGAVSIETASNTKASDPWTPQQVEELIRLGVWLHQRHEIPLRICRTHSDPGFGYHSMFREWSTSGTACPGAARIRQFREVVFPGIVARATGKPTTTPEEEDVAGLNTDDVRKLWLTDGVVANPNPDTADDNPHIAPATALRNIETVVRRLEKKLDALTAALTKES
ncbi:peptidoglycan recognition protein family protein [Streptomyces cadmiisoli]|uniref:peptidoglycan recognition protein family protein n=1 Tax=Streptomyces cadmiisoli TaxID=2184053 RepID=UPI003650277E